MNADLSSHAHLTWLLEWCCMKKTSQRETECNLRLKIWWKFMREIQKQQHIRRKNTQPTQTGLKKIKNKIKCESCTMYAHILYNIHISCIRQIFHILNKYFKYIKFIVSTHIALHGTNYMKMKRVRKAYSKNNNHSSDTQIHFRFLEPMRCDFFE